MAILDSRASYPVAASAALIMERDGRASWCVSWCPAKAGAAFAAPGLIIAVTYAAQHLGSDVVAAFGNRNVIFVK